MSKEIARLKKSKTRVPGTLRQVDVLLTDLGQTQDAISEIERELKNKIKKIKAETLKRLQPLTISRDAQLNALFTFANPRKAELTQKLRTIVLKSGTFGWRLTTPRVESELSDEEIIALFKRTGNEDFIRIIEEVDREGLLKEQPFITGIKYAQSDEFFVVPKQKRKKPKTFTLAIDR